MILHKTYYFDAAHYMENFDDEHKYKKIHGHSYELKIVLSGSLEKKFVFREVRFWSLIGHRILLRVSCIQAHPLSV